MVDKLLFKKGRRSTMSGKLLFETFILISVLLFIVGVFFIVGKSRACAPDPPVAILTAETSKIPVDVNIIFDGSNSYDSEPGTIVKYEWDFDGDDTYDYNETGGSAPDGAFDGNTPHSYSLPGTYIVKLRVTDDDTLTDTDTFTVYVNGTYFVGESSGGGGGGGGSTTGKSWVSPFEYLQDALDAVVAGDEIWVAEGTYYPDDGDSVTEDDRDETFQLISDVNIYGGFEIGDNWEDRDPEKNVTILSGDIGTAGVNTDNSYNVVTGADDVTIDGFTITKGYATGSSDDGGGMYNASCSPTITNCIFSNNYATYGGGVGNFWSTASPTFTNCTFRDNEAVHSGGGTINSNCGIVVYSNCKFIDNTARYGGGTSNGGGTDLTLTNCTFSGNLANDSGGGGICTVGGDVVVTNSIFINNSSTGGVGADGGAISFGIYDSLTLTNCTFANNSAEKYGGGLCIGNGGPVGGVVTVTNCILWGNDAGTSGDEIYNNTSDLTVSYCDVQGGYAGTGNIDSDPCFVNASDPDGGDNIYYTWDDGLRLTIDSNCIDAADGDEAPEKDIAGHGRCDVYATDNTGDGDPNYADMGAYEVGEFRFTVSADNRPNHDKTEDPNCNQRWKHALTQMRDINTGREAGIGEFHIMCGDFDEPTTTHTDFQEYFDNSDILWYPVVGNHEQENTNRMSWIRAEYNTGHNGSRGPLKNFTNQDGPTGSVETTYSFDYDNAHFIVLNQYWNGNTTAGSDRALSTGDINNKLYKWLIEDLYSNTRPVVFVCAHEPAFPQYRNLTDGDFNEKTEHRDRFWKILNDRKVIAYFCGHTHFYYHKQVHSNNSSHYSWQPFTWQIDTGNIGNDSGLEGWTLPNPNHVGDIQTFFDVIVRDGSVQISHWRGAEGDTFKNRYPWTVAVPSDSTAPKIESATAEDANTVVVVFSEWVAEDSANQTSNYSVSIDTNDVNVIGAVLDHVDLDPDYDYKRVKLTIDANIEDGSVGTLTVNNIEDLAGNAIDTNSTEDFMLIGESDTGWKAYNDCKAGGSTSANATDWTIYDDKTDHYTGLLKNITSGSTTGMPTVTFSYSSGNLVSTGSTGANPDSDTDAHDIFDGFIDFETGGHISYSDTEDWWVGITFTNLDPDAEYTFVGTTIRTTEYDDRFTLCTIDDITSCDNNSSSGIHDPDGLGSYIDGNVTSYLACYNSDTLGYVVRWDNIKCGPDGAFTVKTEVDVENDNHDPDYDNKAYPFSGFMLEKEGFSDENEPNITGFTPADDANEIPVDANLTVDVNDANDGLMKVVFYGRKVEEDFTIIALPDTQNYVRGDDDANLPYFEAQTDWIVEQEVNENIVFVTHEGDIVHNDDYTEEWTEANDIMSVLDGNVPYGLLAGNHDQPTTYYNQYFPYTRYENESWYGGHFPNNGNENNYQLFSAGGMDLLVLHIEYPPQNDTPFETWADATFPWADTVLKSYPNRKAIITSHVMINGSGNCLERGKEIWNALVMPNQNVCMVLCGHVLDVDRVIHNPVCGHDVPVLLANYQGEDHGGNGFLRVMKFKPSEDTVDVNTFSPYIDENEPGESPHKTDSENDFDLTVLMDNDFEVIGTDFVAGDNTAAMTWTGLDADTEYQWYVEVTDASGNVVSSSSTWSFTTDDD